MPSAAGTRPQFGQSVSRHLRVMTMEEGAGAALFHSVAPTPGSRLAQERAAGSAGPSSSSPGHLPGQRQRKRPRHDRDSVKDLTPPEEPGTSSPGGPGPVDQVTARTILYLYLIECRRSETTKAPPLHAAYARSLPAAYNLPIFWPLVCSVPLHCRLASPAPLPTPPWPAGSDAATFDAISFCAGAPR